jgi:hypothetical protein
MVRGYWGDIINSPYVTFGTEVENEKHREMFFKKVNFQRVYVSLSFFIAYR